MNTNNPPNPPNPPVSTSRPRVHKEAIMSSLVIFFGSGGVGKTATLLRLIQYLHTKTDYKCSINTDFRTDPHYQNETVPAFNKDLASPHVIPNRTGALDFLLVDVHHNGNLYCQILEAKGEDFFNRLLTDPVNAQWEPYLAAIRSSDVKKIYTIFYEQEMFNDVQGLHPKVDLMQLFALRASNFIAQLNDKRDKLLLLYSKIDRNPNIFAGDTPNIRALQQIMFAGHFAIIEKTLRARRRLRQPILIPFSNGAFYPDQNQLWVHSHDKYPVLLWRAIDYSIQGNSFYYTY